MKYWRLSLIFLTLITVLSFANSKLPLPNNSLAPPGNSLQPIDKIIVIVNDDVITSSELQEAINAAKQQAEQSGMSLPTPKVLRNMILNQLIYQKIQLQLAKRNNITTTDEQVDAAIGRIATRNHATVAQLKMKIESQGYTYGSFRKQIRKQLIIATLQREAIGPQVKVNQTDVQNYLTQYRKQASQQGTQRHVLDILIPQTDKASEQLATLIAKRLKSGALVSQVISGSVTQNDMGWQSDNDLPDLFVAQLKRMKNNQISSPIKAPNGYHVLKLLGTRTKVGALPTEAQAQQAVFQQKFQKALQDWLDKLKESSSIKIMDDRD